MISMWYSLTKDANFFKNPKNIREFKKHCEDNFNIMDVWHSKKIDKNTFIIVIFGDKQYIYKGTGKKLFILINLLSYTQITVLCNFWKNLI